MRKSEQVARAYLTADPRSVSLGRIGLALVLLVDLLGRASNLQNFYTGTGLLPNPNLLGGAWLHGGMSFFSLASGRVGATLGFLLCAGSYLCLLFGYRTRVAHVASFLCLLSLRGRLIPIQTDGDIVLSQLVLWTMFLPTGRRFSIDSLRARLRAHPEDNADDLADRLRFEPDSTPFVSLAVGAVALQMVCIYALTAIQQSGATWRNGSAVHYVLYQDRIATSLGILVRDALDPWSAWVLTRAIVMAEVLLAVLLALPVFLRRTRQAAIGLALALHLGGALFVNLGLFTLALTAFLPFLLQAADWDAVEAWWRRRPGSRVVIFDGTCGICFQIVRVLARLDRPARLRLVRSTAAGPFVGGELSAALLDQTIVVIDPSTGRHWTRAVAFGEIARFLPLGRPFAWLMGLPGVRQVADVAYEAFARRRSRISEALGMAACGVPARVDRIADAPVPAPARLVTRRWRGWTPIARELVVVLVVVLAGSQLLVDNPVLARAVPWQRPGWVQRGATLLGLSQRWTLFAPDPPRTNMNIAVDALTMDGRRVDPFNELANPGFPAPGSRIPSRLGRNALLSAYAVSLATQPEIQRAFTGWILRYSERTGRQGDRIASFVASVIEEPSPPPSGCSAAKAHAHARAFLKYPAAP